MNQSLQQVGRQAWAIWKQLGVNQRLSLVLATLVVLGGLIGLALWSHRTDYGLLYGRLDEAEAAKIVAALEADKVPYKIGAGGGSILVPTDRVYPLRMQLAGKGLPKGDGVGFEIFEKNNFGISDFVQRVNYLRAVQGELARTISQLDEIEAARVMIVMPENRLLTDPSRKPTASVFVKVRSQGPLPSSAVNSIRFLVANSVEGLQVQNVSVVDNRGTVLSETTEPDSVAGLTATQLAVRRQLEQYLAKKAETMLEAVLGPGRALVRVSADLNFDTLTRTQETYDPDGVVVEDTEKEDRTESGNALANQGVGTATNASTSTNNPTGATPVTTTKNSNLIKTKRYDISKTTSSLMQQPGSIKRLSAAIFIAKRVEGAGKERKEVALTQAEKEALTKLVKSALGIQEGADAGRQDEITLEEWSFNEQPAQELTQQLEHQERQQLWWTVGRHLLYPALAGMVLLGFWRSVRKTPVESIPIGIPLGQFLAGTPKPQVIRAGEGGNGNGHGNGHGSGPGQNPRFGGLEWRSQESPGVVTVEVLNQLIKENPANMTQAVRSWLTRGKTGNK